jgi:hypothetical protein
VTHTQPDVRQALRDADWEKLLPGLLAYAAACLRRAGWAAGRDEEASKMSVEQVVNHAVELCLDGTRAWDSSAVDLPGLLRGIIRSLVSSERKKYVRARTVTNSETVERHAGVADSSEDEIVEEEGREAILALVESCAAGDADLLALHGAILDGHLKRDDIAAALGWNVDRVTAARIKLQRRLLKKAPEAFADVCEKQRRIS